MKVTVDKSVWEKMKKNMLAASNIEGRLGWFPEDVYGADNNNLPMAYIAMLNEEGHINGSDSLVPGAITPPRPFMRVNLRAALKSGSNDKEFRAMVQAVVDGKSIMKPLQAAGNEFQNTLRKVMLDFSNPPNAPLTVEMKGFDDPLRDTSQLIANVNYKVAKRNS